MRGWHYATPQGVLTDKLTKGRHKVSDYGRENAKAMGAALADGSLLTRVMESDAFQQDAARLAPRTPEGKLEGQWRDDATLALADVAGRMCAVDAGVAAYVRRRDTAQAAAHAQQSRPSDVLRQGSALEELRNTPPMCLLMLWRFASLS